MKVLLVHNFYQQSGGEDLDFALEGNSLEEHGHKVIRYSLHNSQIGELSQFQLARATLWNQNTYRKLRALARHERPDIAHFHNTFPLISPSAYYAVKAEKVPIVQFLHNYRLLCLNALFFRDQRVCEDCLGKFIPWPGVIHGCYRGSRKESSGVAALLSVHRILKTWTSKVDVYIALTEFARNKFIQGGLPAKKIMIKPHFVSPDPGIGSGDGKFALFIGRLSQEKGVETLLTAWKHLGKIIPLRIVGDGPLASQVAAAAEKIPGVVWMGRKSITEVYDLIGHAGFLVLPSEWYETFGRVAMEAFAKGTPVIVVNIGAIAEFVENGHTGLHFRSGDPEDLIDKVEWIIKNPQVFGYMRQAARAEFEGKYTSEKSYQTLMNIYQTAMR